MADIYLGDKVIGLNEAVYLDDTQTARIYNDNGTLKMQIKENDTWVDQEAFGS